MTCLPLDSVISEPVLSEPVLYRLDRKAAAPAPEASPDPAKSGPKTQLWAAFTPGVHGLRRTWQLSVAARSRGGATVRTPLLETSALRPLATVTIKGEAYPLTIDWHEKARGGRLCFGGERRLGLDGGVLLWEMRWTPAAALSGAFEVEMRVRTTPRRTGSLQIHLPLPLFCPEEWSLDSRASSRVAWAAQSGWSVGVTFADGAVASEDRGGLTLEVPTFSLGGGRLIGLGLRFAEADSMGAARAALVTLHAGVSGPALHPLSAVSPLCPQSTVARLTAPDAHAVQGMERLYLKPPAERDTGSFYAGWPYEPAGALKALNDWNRVQETPEVPRLVRFGARGLCADFQVMGRGDAPEPNKGAFWDKLTMGMGTDFADGATHGILSNARLARSLFGLHAQTGEALLRQSALNISQWLLLKQNRDGFYDGERVHATRGLEGDGRILPQPCSLDGAEAIRAFVPAYRATGNEVWIKAAWRVADFLLEGRGRDFDCIAPGTVAGVILSLLTLNREAPNPRLHAALTEWGAWLRTLPLDPALPSLSPDGLHLGLFDCAGAGFGLFGLTRDPAYLRYAFAALCAVPPASRTASWRSIAAHQSALISLAGLLPGSDLDFEGGQVSLDWRVFAPDPAAAPFLRVTPAGGSEAAIKSESVIKSESETWADWLPLVCRATDQLLLLVLAPPAVPAVSVWKNNKRPLLRDLRTGAVDSDAPLAPLGRERWANIGLFTVDP